MYKDRFVNLHRHSQHSSFDGYGTQLNAAQYAKEMGQTALGLTDHGTTSGLIAHYNACNEVGIKPILGVEAYFQTKFKPTGKYYHVCLFAMSQLGYQNICKVLTEAAQHNYYRTAKVTFDLLEQNNEDVICTSGCIAGFIPNQILNGKPELAEKAAKKFKQIFGDRFYLEVMPYYVGEGGLDQGAANEAVLNLAEQLNIEVIATVDSHYIRPEEYNTYQIMHKIAGHKDVADYSERYMPRGEEVYLKVRDQLGKHALKAISNTQKLADRCNVEFDFDEGIPKSDWGMSSKAKLKELIGLGYKRKRKLYAEAGYPITKAKHKEYVARIKHEFKVIAEDLQFEDYFLLCYDIMRFARENDVAIGPGRGSVCGSLVANLIGITEVDPIIFGTTFERFLRSDKTKLPDIDMDFGRESRHKVLEYIMETYEGRAAQIATFGFYRSRNLANDLIKVLGIPAEESKELKLELEKVVLDQNQVTYNQLIKNPRLRRFDRKYDNFCLHFSRLLGQIRFIGKHAAGVAITVGPIWERVALMKSHGMLITSYDLNDLGKIGVLKMDILGLATASILHETCKLADTEIVWNDVNDKEVYKRFRAGETEGVFQFEKATAKDILKQINCSNIQDLIAANALNRPAPLKLGVLDDFVRGKQNPDDHVNSPWYEYTKETYGTIIFQEDVMKVCREVAGLDWPDVDKIMKSLRVGEDEDDPMRDKFVSGAMRVSKFKRSEAEALYNKVTLYSFNKGHCAAYSLIGYKAMELRLKNPLEFWCATLFFENDESKRDVYKGCASRDGCIILLPHVNGLARDGITTLEGDKVIQEGIASIKGIGPGTAKVIVEAGPYIDFPDFEEKVQALPPAKRRTITSATIRALKESGALEFREKQFLKRVVSYNSALYGRKLSIW